MASNSDATQTQITFSSPAIMTAHQQQQAQQQRLQKGLTQSVQLDSARTSLWERRDMRTRYHQDLLTQQRYEQVFYNYTTAMTSGIIQKLAAMRSASMADSTVVAYTAQIKCN